MCNDEPHGLAFMRAAIRATVDSITPWDELEVQHRRDVLHWIDSGADIYRVAKPDTPPKHLVSYCVVVDDRHEQALLVDHRDAQRWLPTGGHMEVGERPHDAARRELAEELGITPPFHPIIGPTPLLVTVTQTGGRSTPHVDVSLWFVFETSASTHLSPDATEFAASKWWSFDDIVAEGDTPFDPHLPRFIAKLRSTINNAA